MLSYLGLFCHFIMDKMGQNFHKIEAVRLEGVDPPSPPKAVSLTAFSQFFFNPSLSYFHLFQVDPHSKRLVPIMVAGGND